MRGVVIRASFPPATPAGTHFALSLHFAIRVAVVCSFFFTLFGL
jgi:hypothetical protein